MSKARPIADAERTATMLDLLRRSYEGDYPDQKASRAYVVLEEVAPGTGFIAQRWADVLALSVWPSNGLTLDGFEIKASRSDLKREIAMLSKHAATARYCDSWTLLAWDDSVLVDGIPDEWGIQVTKEGEHGRELVVRRRAAKRTPEPWPRHFVCSLVRNAYEQSPGAAYVARSLLATVDNLRAEHKRRHRSDLLIALKPVALALYGKDEWHWPAAARDPEQLIRHAVERLNELPLLREA